MRRTLASLMPMAAAIVRVLQFVALAGFRCSVISTTCFTRPSVMVRVLPGRRELLLARLHQQGALTLDLNPEALTSSVLNQYLMVKERAMV